MRISEESGYDFNFLITIMKYVKKSKDVPLGNPSVVNQNKVDLKQDASSKPIEPSIVKSNNFSEAETTSTSAVSLIPSTIQAKEATNLESEAPVMKTDVKKAPSQSYSQNIPQQTVSSKKITVDSLHELKEDLEQKLEPQKRVINGVGQQAFKEFCSLVSTLNDRSLVIEDLNIKTLYYTIYNFSMFPVHQDLRQCEPLSNFALKLQPFVDLRNLFKKDENIRKIVADKLEQNELDNFEMVVEKLCTTMTDFVLVDQDANLLRYHRVRNCLIDNMMSRLKVIHNKIETLDTSAAPEIFRDSAKMLSSLMNTHYNGQVLMMEKIKFNFDFLTTILDYLKVLTASQEEVSIKNMQKIQQLDPLKAVIRNLSKDVSNTALLLSIENILTQKLCRAYINTMNAAVKDDVEITTDHKRGIYSIKNAILLYKSNYKLEDQPLTNVALEVSKIVSLLNFINKDTGIRSAIVNKHGEVAIKELETLVKAHSERKDDFVTKFAEKNIKLYHSLRNTALERILKQITLVHSKVKNIDIPESAKNSTQYHHAIQRLEDIVTAESVSKMLIIEEQKFDFDFLSTILLVWKSETAKQAEEKRLEEEKRQEEIQKQEEKKKAEEKRWEAEEMRQAEEKKQKELTKPTVVTSQVQIPATVVVKKTSSAFISRVDEENVDDPESSVIEIDDDTPIIEKINVVAPSSRRSWSNKSNMSVVNSRNVRPVATVTPMQPITHVVPYQASYTDNFNKKRDNWTSQNASASKIATKSNLMQIIDGKGELPIRTKCHLCNDRESSNMLQLIHHYSVTHYRPKIEQYIKTDTCPSCSEKFEEVNDLIKHLGLVHGTVNLVLTQTEQWICEYCKKEFLTEEFLKKHLIRLHLEKRFESTFLALSENNEILCQFCEQTFEMKEKLFVHIGIDHDKLKEILPVKNDAREDIRCRHCELETGITSLKIHYIQTHYKDTFEKYCKELNLINDGNSCKYCLVEYGDAEGLLEHLGLEHNLILKLIANFQGKNVSAQFRENPTLKSLAELAEMKSSMQEENNQEQEMDPLLTETLFVDASQQVTSPVKTAIKLVSPTKLKSQQKNNQSNRREMLKTPTSTSFLSGKRTAPFKMPTSGLFLEFKSFCHRQNGDKEAKSIVQSRFQVFKPQIFENYLEEFCQSVTRLKTLEELISVFVVTYPLEKVKTLPFIVKFLTLREYSKYSDNLKTTFEECSPMHTVIFLSQLLAKPGFKIKELEWLIKKISSMHNKVEGKPLVCNKKIVDFFDAVGITLETPQDTSSDNTTLEEIVNKDANPAPIVKNDPVKCQSCKSTFTSQLQLKAHALSCQNKEKRSSSGAEMLITSAKKLKTSVAENARNTIPTITNKATEVSDQKTVAKKSSDTNITNKPDGNDDSEVTVIDEEDPAPIKQEKSDAPLKPLSLNEEPEIIDIDDEDDAEVDYKYFCLECEGCAGRKCDHLDHPRVPLPFDMRTHFKSTGHLVLK